jgi:predicted O-methyltransferase YrrM
MARLIRAIVPARFRPIGYVEHLVRRKTRERVAAGPFCGMRYVRKSVGSAYVPKLLGIYERELNKYIEQACDLGFKLIIDIGAAEGYYAVGIARRNPNARVIAFEMESKGREAVRDMAELNKVSGQIEIRGKCELEDLEAVVGSEDGSLVICDVEGYEEELLRPDRIPMLTQAHLLVETHDFIQSGIAERIAQRFASTHDIQRIWQESRTHNEIPYRTLGRVFLPRKYLDFAVSEWRPVQMSWLWMQPRGSNPTA